MIITETPRLILRQFTWDDLDTIAEILADPEGIKYIGNGVPKTHDEVKQWMQCWIQDGEYAWSNETLQRVPQVWRAVERKAHFSMWAVIEKSSVQLFGRCGLLAWNLDGQLEVEVGYQLTCAFWGKGLATEAAIAARDCGMNQLAFDRLISVIHPENLPSQRVAEKIGMRHEKDTIVRGLPVQIYSISRTPAENELTS